MLCVPRCYFFFFLKKKKKSGINLLLPLAKLNFLKLKPCNTCQKNQFPSFLLKSLFIDLSPFQPEVRSTIEMGLKGNATSIKRTCKISKKYRNEVVYNGAICLTHL